MDGKPEGECEDLTDERPEDVVEELKVEEVKGEMGGNDDLKVEDSEEDDSDDDSVMETMPQMDAASVIKYSVRTTPYLQR